METMRARMATASRRSVSRLRIRSPTKRQTSDQGTPGTGCLPGKGAYASGSHSRLPSGRPTRMRGRNLTGDERHPGGRHLHHGRCHDGVEGSHRHGRRQKMNQDHAQRAVIQMAARMLRAACSDPSTRPARRADGTGPERLHGLPGRATP